MQSPSSPSVLSGLGTPCHTAPCRMRRRRGAAPVAALLAMAVMGACGTAQTRTIGTPDLAITNVAVVDVVSGNVLEDRTLLITDGRIVSTGPSSTLSVPPGTQRVDATGQYVMPGMWDAHVHSAAGTSWHFPLLIAHGITSVRNMHTTVDTSLALTNAVKRRLAEGELTGPRFIANGGVVDGDPAVWPGSVTVRNGAEARAAVDSLADGGADFIKIYDRLTRAAFDGVMEQARRRGISVDGHVPMAVAPEDAAAAGMRTVEHGSGMNMGCSSKADSLRAVHAGQMSTPDTDGSGLTLFGLIRSANETRDEAACRETVDAFREHGVAVTPTLVAYHEPATLMADTAGLRMLPAAIRRQWAAMAAGPDPAGEVLSAGEPQRVANVRMLHDGGVTLLAGTDLGNPFLVPGRSLHHELELLVRQAGLSPLEAIRTATSNPARVFGMADSLGVVATGMRADLVLLRANPLADIRNTRAITGVVLDGRFLDRTELDALIEAAKGAM